MLGGLTLTLSFTGGGFFLGVFLNASARKFQNGYSRQYLAFEKPHDTFTAS